jgi:hypothetical protein
MIANGQEYPVKHAVSREERLTSWQFSLVITWPRSKFALLVQQSP